jgi:phosphoglycolate phosphatase-like HAD superfamily hydrolase
MSERDSHFAGFAERLWNELQETDVLFSMLFSRQDRTALQQIIARHAYDLVEHALNRLHEREVQNGAYSPGPEHPTNIPDMPALPD